MTKQTKPQLSLWSRLPKWAWKQGLRNGIDFTRNPDSSGGRPETTRPQHCADIKQAQVITSRVEYPQQTDMHKPVLDIDFPIQCVPSTTEGHFHLFMDKELTWTQYRRLLDALADAGIIEQGYRNASIAREYTSVRVPWVRKEPPAEPPTEPPAPEGTEPASAPQNATQARPEGIRGTPPRPADPILRHILEDERRRATQAAMTGVDRPRASVTYNRQARLFTVISDSDPNGERPLTVTEEMWHQQINGRDSNHLATPLRTRLQNAGLPAASIGQAFARAWERGIQREPRTLRRPRMNDSGRILGDALEAEAQRQAREAAAQAEMATHYTRTPIRATGLTASGRWEMVENTPAAPPYFEAATPSEPPLVGRAPEPF